MPTSSSLQGGRAGRVKEGLIHGWFVLSGALSILILLGIFITLFTTAIDAFSADQAMVLSEAERAMLSPEEIAEVERLAGTTPSLGAFLFQGRWNPGSLSEPGYGVGAMVVSTLMTSVMALLIAAPVGVGVAAWLSAAAPPRIRELVKPIIELLAAIPSVVVGFVGIVVIGPLLARITGASTGLNALNGAVLLAIMALPTIVSIAEDALNAVPSAYRQASLALGADRWQTLVKVELPAALSGIVAAVMLGLGRAIGETMTVLMVCGNALEMPEGPLDPVRTMAATIAIELGEVPRDTTHFSMLFAVGLLLFGMTLAVNLIADAVQRSRAELAG